MKPVVVVIAGGSGSGKTSLVRTLVSMLGPARCATLELDSYYRDLSTLDPAARRKTNFDHPDAFEFDLFSQHVRDLLQHKVVPVPIYAFATHTRIGTRPLSCSDILIVEGILALYDKSCRDLAALKVFIDIPHDIRLQRRIARDVKERGWSESEVRSQYESVVRPMYDQFVEPTKACADVIISLADQTSCRFEPLVQRIEALT